MTKMPCSFPGWIDSTVGIMSAEFLLRRFPNGGTVVLLRSVWVTLITYSAAVGTWSFLAPNATLDFSLLQARSDVRETFPWIGAIFAGSYAALYSRFAAQWSYLADLFNQISAAAVQIEAGGALGVDPVSRTPDLLREGVRYAQESSAVPGGFSPTDDRAGTGRPHAG